MRPFRGGMRILGAHNHGFVTRSVTKHRRTFDSPGIKYRLEINRGYILGRRVSLGQDERIPQACVGQNYGPSHTNLTARDQTKKRQRAFDKLFDTFSSTIETSP